MPRKSKRLIHLLGEVDVPYGKGKATVIQTCSEGSDDGQLELVVPVESGKPLPMGATKIAILKKHDDQHYQCDVVDAEELTSGNGPAMVSNESYRQGWDQTFGKHGLN